jgi:hypothetical protein
MSRLLYPLSYRAAAFTSPLCKQRVCVPTGAFPPGRSGPLRRDTPSRPYFIASISR